MKKPEIVLLGSGHVATHIGHALQKNGNNICQIFSRNILHAQALANQVMCQKYTDKIQDLYDDADVYILALSDDALLGVSKKISLKKSNQIIVHTSGSIPMTVLENSAANYGVFYPLQTFTKNRKVDFEQIPICIESSNEWVLQTHLDMASELSSKVYQIQSEQRLALHISAIFANNFSNYMYQIAEKILHTQNIPFDILKPLIRETAEKVMEHSPVDIQTGPAKRGDVLTIEKHTAFLSSDPTYKEIYQLISNSIQNQYSK